MLLEICANSYQSAVNAQKAGAHRIELCSELSIGGVTPSFGVLKKVTETLEIPVHVLIRPRSGDFCFSNAAFEIMKENIKLCKGLGCDGIVSGVLNPDNTIDLNRTNQLLELAKPMAFTFHRAFDCVPSPMEALGQLMAFKVDRILTSGQKPTAEEGLSLLNQLKKAARNRTIILPGSGIGAENAKLFKDFGFGEIHASASKKVLKKDGPVTFGGVVETESDVELIRSILDAVSG